MKIELKHLAPYLPYGLKVKIMDHTALMGITSGIDIIGINRVLEVQLFKPILRPMSDLDKMAEIQASMGLHTQEDVYFTISTPLASCWYDFKILLENHFDVFGLIPAGLAVDINTI